MQKNEISANSSNADQKQMTLSHEEFARRFEQHILPKRIVKIRHGGYLGTQWQKQAHSSHSRAIKPTQTNAKSNHPL